MYLGKVSCSSKHLTDQWVGQVVIENSWKVENLGNMQFLDVVQVFVYVNDSLQCRQL